MDAELARYIVRVAREEGFDPVTALAFAYAETGVENIVGDRDLYRRKGYMDGVAREHPDNPGLHDPSAWASYGPFQLQARWFVRDGEHPSELLRPEISVPRAVRRIKTLVAKYGSVDSARLAYVCGMPENCSVEKRRRILDRLDAALARAASFVDSQDGVLAAPLVAGVPGRVASAGVMLATALWLLWKARDE